MSDSYFQDGAAESSAICGLYQGLIERWGQNGPIDGVGVIFGPPSPPARGTLNRLVFDYLNHPRSTFHGMRYQVRIRRAQSLRRLTARYGSTPLAEIRGQTILDWYEHFSDHKRLIATGHTFVSDIRTLAGFGVTILDCSESGRIAGVMSKFHFPVGAPRTERITFEQAQAICEMAHEFARPSIALAQAIQFECMLRQKDVIGEIVPISEPGIGLPWRNKKWMRGIVWSEIDGNLILRHVTSKTQKAIEFDLKNCPLVLRELSYLAAVHPGKRHGAIIKCETTGLPWIPGEYRRAWRAIADAAGVPKEVRNQDSRAGGITEAVEAGAQVDQIRQTATHSNASTTQRYIRGSYQESSTNVQNLRIARRQAKNGGAA